MDEYVKTNRDKWDALAPIHAASAFYDVEGFKRGRCTLFDVERREVGDVSGKSLLHLQCHFGLDTLSWARLGADVVGMDFSETAIRKARALAEELGITARFVCCDLYDLPDRPTEKFDVVFTSSGVLCWLHDLTRWGVIAADFLKPGGTFYIHEFHPNGPFYSEPGTALVPVDGISYLHTSRPERYEDEGTYADSDVAIKMPAYEWNYGLSDVVTALAQAGLQIEFLHEYPHCAFKAMSSFVRSEDGLWYWPANTCGLPLMFSIRARKS